mmetsp:Transcript_74138/g.200518  ORF Transcript_74138/g.200518 Transcript_74138/m.200518 type:complete len:216 (-) Transcript_74138:836-1483(-)
MPIRSGSALVASVLKPCSNRYRSTRKLNRAQSSKPNSENKGFPPPTSVMFSTANTSTISFGSSLVASSSCFLASSSLASPSFASLSFASLSASLASPSLESPSLASPSFAASLLPSSAPSGFSAFAASPSAALVSSACACSSSFFFLAAASACLAGSPAFHSFALACQPCSTFCHSSSLVLKDSEGCRSSIRHSSFCLRAQVPKAFALSFSACQS